MSPQGQSILVQITRALLALVLYANFFQVFCSVFFKGHSPWHLQKLDLLQVFQTIYIPS